jgi:MoxR-like ATPase/transcriptional regulator with XRE-family HTH domain
VRPEIKKIQEQMEAAEYVTDAPIATSVHLALALGKPLLIEGHAGVGKTEVAKVMARMLGTNLIRLQCYEGLDASTALYEWNYQKQLLHIKLSEQSNSRPLTEQEHEIFSEPFLLRRPLLQAISQTDRGPVLLVDEVDRCVAARTLVSTTSGLKQAEEITVGDELVSFDPVGYQTRKARVKSVVPRMASRVLRLLVGGRFLEVTPEHRFVRYTDAGHEVVQASALRVGDRLPLYKAIPLPEAGEPHFDFPENIVKLALREKRALHQAYRASRRTYQTLATAIGVSRGHLRNVIQPRSYRDSLRAGVLEALTRELGVGEHRADGGGPASRVVQSTGFYELLGYIVADGCFTSDRLCIADKDRENLELYAAKFDEAFGVRPRIIPGPHRNYELTYHSLPLGRYLRRVLGAGMTRSRDRLVPPFVFSLPKAKRAAFVRGYFDGEGWVGDHQVSVVSASPYLLVGIQCLLNSLNVDGHIRKVSTRPDTFGKGPYYQLTISDAGAFALSVGFCAPAKRARLSRLPDGHRFTRTETLPRGAVTEVLETIKGAGTMNGQPAHQTIYDILAGRVTPNASSLRKIAVAFDSASLWDLLDRGVVLGEITAVDVVEAPQPVYDFVLEGQPYFVANQIVTHNCDEEFEAFMLEVFSDWQVTIPEVGPIKAVHPPHVVLTSNRTRELSDALRRRCLYLWIDYPSFEKEVRIVERKVPGINARLAREVAHFMEALRRVRLSKVPGVAESLDWARALVSLHADHLEERIVTETLGVVLKDADDIKRFRAEVAKAGLTPFLPVQS